MFWTIKLYLYLYFDDAVQHYLPLLGSFPDCVTPKTIKWYLMPPCLNLSNIRNVPRVKWNNPGKRAATSPTPWCCSY